MLAEKNKPYQQQELKRTTQNTQFYFYRFNLKTVTVIVCLKYSSTLTTYNFDSILPVFIKTMNEIFVLILTLF